MGILMIIFGSLGLLGALVGLATGGMGFGSQGLPKGIAEKIASLSKITNLVGLAFAAAQLYVGIALVRYKHKAPSMAAIYAIAALVWAVVSVVLTQQMMMPLFEDAPAAMRSAAKMGMVIGALIGMVWPTLILILTSRPSAKAACVN